MQGGGCGDGGGSMAAETAETAADNWTKHYMHPSSLGMHDNNYAKE